jgi:mono/diheme cytochrome c family protein
MKSALKIIVVLVVMIVFSSCKNSKSPNYQYMPNMYESVAYETYSESESFNSPTGLKGKEGQLPANHSLKRGSVPYEFPNSTEGYEAAKLNSESPLTSETVDYAKGQELFEIYCGICHGNKGNGKGWLVTQEKILGVPSYATRVITEGSINHVLNYGLNSMGAYSNQLNQTERWQVAAYVMKLKSEL